MNKKQPPYRFVVRKPNGLPRDTFPWYSDALFASVEGDKIIYQEYVDNEWKDIHNAQLKL